MSACVLHLCDPGPLLGPNVEDCGRPKIKLTAAGAAAPHTERNDRAAPLLPVARGGKRKEDKEHLRVQHKNIMRRRRQLLSAAARSSRRGRPPAFSDDVLFLLLGFGTCYLVPPVGLFLQVPVMQTVLPEGLRLASSMNVAVNIPTVLVPFYVLYRARPNSWKRKKRKEGGTAFSTRIRSDALIVVLLLGNVVAALLAASSWHAVVNGTTSLALFSRAPHLQGIFKWSFHPSPWRSPRPLWRAITVGRYAAPHARMLAPRTLPLAPQRAQPALLLRQHAQHKHKMILHIALRLHVFLNNAHADAGQFFCKRLRVWHRQARASCHSSFDSRGPILCNFVKLDHLLQFGHVAS